jgi:hypothetical protein
MPNMLYQNDGAAFHDVTNAAHVGHLQKGHAVSMADFDNDGDLDMFEQMGGFVPGDKYYDVLYENPGNTGNWLRVRIVGRRSNRAGIGARIRVRVRDDVGERSVYRDVTSGGSFGANPLEQHMGIGDATSIEQIEVFWPVTGNTDVYAKPPINQRIVLTEGSDKIDIVH